MARRHSRGGLIYDTKAFLIHMTGFASAGLRLAAGIWNGIARRGWRLFSIWIMPMGYFDHSTEQELGSRDSSKCAMKAATYTYLEA